MRSKKILLAFLGLAMSMGLAHVQAEYYQAIEMAQSGPIQQNRFYPRWSPNMSLSATYYGIPSMLCRPTKEQKQKWKKIVGVFLDDLFEQAQGGRARIFSPEGLINPVILRDGREYFQCFWKDKTENVRHVTDDIQVIALAETFKWSEVWVRFVEVDRYPSIQHTNYVAMLIETPPDDEPYLADCKVLGRAPTNLQTDIYLRQILGAGHFAKQPANNK